MAFLDSLLGRFGYVRLNEFGLVRTPDGRIVMLHRRVLDDGAGGRIVGWRAEDPAPTVLEPMDLVPRTAVKQVEAARASVAAARVPAAVVAAVQASKPRAPTAASNEGDEDEWEWQLAMARARAAAEEVERAAASARAASPIGSAIVSKELPTLVGVTKSEPVLAVAKLTPARVASPPPPPVVKSKTPTPAKPMAVVKPAPVAPVVATKPAAPKPIAVIVPTPPTPVPSPVPAGLPSRVIDPVGAALGAVPIERARIARGSSMGSPRVMAPPRHGPRPSPEPPRARVEPARPEPARVTQPIRAGESRPLPLPPPEDTTRTQRAPEPRPIAVVAAAAQKPRRNVASMFDGEITQTDGRPPLPRFSARFR